MATSRGSGVEGRVARALGVSESTGLKSAVSGARCPLASVWLADECSERRCSPRRVTP